MAEYEDEDTPRVKDDYIFPKKQLVVDDAEKPSVAHHVIAGTVTWALAVLFGMIIPFVFSPVIEYTLSIFIPKAPLPIAEIGQTNETLVNLNAANYVDDLIQKIGLVGIVWVVLAFCYLIVLVYQLRIAVISGGFWKAVAVAFTVVMPFTTIFLLPIWFEMLYG